MAHSNGKISEWIMLPFSSIKRLDIRTDFSKLEKDQNTIKRKLKFEI